MFFTEFRELSEEGSSILKGEEIDKIPKRDEGKIAWNFFNCKFSGLLMEILKREKRL
jgi:hypothetical protein